MKLEILKVKLIGRRTVFSYVFRVQKYKTTRLEVKQLEIKKNFVCYKEVFILLYPILCLGKVFSQRIS